MKTFKIYDGDGDSHEYDIDVNQTDKGTVYTLRYSHLPAWTYPGQEIMSATDHGHGIKFSNKFDKDIEYDAFGNLRILMNFITKYDTCLMLEYTYSQENRIKL